MMRSFFAIVGVLTTIVAFQNCGQSFSTLEGTSLKLNLEVPNSEATPASATSESISTPVTTAPIPAATEGLVEEPLPAPVVSSPTPPATPTTPETPTTEEPAPVVVTPPPSTPEPTPVATPTPPAPNPAPAPTPEPVVAPTPAPIERLNGERILTQLSISIDEPSVLPQDTIMDIASAVPLSVPSNANRPDMTAAFCNYGNVDLQNQNGEIFNIRSGMRAGSTSCSNLNMNIQGLMRVKSRLRIKGSLTLAGVLIIEPGGELIVEGAFLHIGESRNKPGLLWIKPGGALIHKMKEVFVGRAQVVQYGYVINQSTYRVGVDAEQRAGQFAKVGYLMDINIGDQTKTDLLRFSGE